MKWHWSSFLVVLLLIALLAVATRGEEGSIALDGRLLASEESSACVSLVSCPSCVVEKDLFHCQGDAF